MKLAVLLSGGLDSTTALYWAHKWHDVVCAISFSYGSNHAEREQACARWHCEKLGIPLLNVDISGLSAHLDSGLLQGAAAIPDGDYRDETMKKTVVPFRNGIFLSIAAGIAESKGADFLVIAAHAGDHDIYPDCRREFMEAMDKAIKLGTYKGVRILTPFIHESKGDIVLDGDELEVDYSHTYSCYKGREKHCGQCGTCRERKEAFAMAGIPDPTEYES